MLLLWGDYFQDVYLIHIQQLISQLWVSTLQSLADSEYIQ